MIFKEADDRSDDIAELKRLKAAAAPAFQAAIQKQIDRIYAGVAGEKDAAHFLKREFGQSENIAVLHDIRLEVDGDYVQIDHLVMHRVQRAAWVLETKNYSGRLSCDEHGDWTVWRGGKPTSIPSPIAQARRHCEALRSWMDENKITAIQALHPVVLISPTSSVNRSKLPTDAHVVKSDNFAAWWRTQTDAIGFGKALGIVGRHLLSGMTADDFVALGQRLVRAHVPPAYNWRAMLRLPISTGSAQTSVPEPAASIPVIDPPPSGSDSQVFSTPHGSVTITRIPDGRYALRNDKNEALIELVKGACRGKAQWNPRYRNWLIAEAELPGIVGALNAKR